MLRNPALIRKRIVIVGAGLGGSLLADSLADYWDITVINPNPNLVDLGSRVVDVGWPAVTKPHIGTGLGGTTEYWHNGLIEVSEEVFNRYWPIDKSELIPFYDLAFRKLCGLSRDQAETQSADLREKLIAIGISPPTLGKSLFYPYHRINPWDKFNLSARVNLVLGEAVSFCHNNENEIISVEVKQGVSTLRVYGDVFVVASGGLGTPLLLQKLAKTSAAPGLKLAGFGYEDHPHVFVGEVKLSNSLKSLWNYPLRMIKGCFRIPMVISLDGYEISFQLRPAVSFSRALRRNKVASILSNLRNYPFHFQNYFRLFWHLDDLLEIVSFRFNLTPPTKRYSILMVAQQPSQSNSRSVWQDDVTGQIYRDWVLESSYLDTLNKSVDSLVNILSNKIASLNIFNSWQANIVSSSHHSGTARMSSSPECGVCDEKGRVFGLQNLYVCDGSLIPGSGIANTGLTIGALAIRMAHHLNEICAPGAD